MIKKLKDSCLAALHAELQQPRSLLFNPKPFAPIPRFFQLDWRPHETPNLKSPTIHNRNLVVRLFITSPKQTLALVAPDHLWFGGSSRPDPGTVTSRQPFILGISFTLNPHPKP